MTHTVRSAQMVENQASPDGNQGPEKVRDWLKVTQLVLSRSFLKLIPQKPRGGPPELLLSAWGNILGSVHGMMAGRQRELLWFNLKNTSLSLNLYEKTPGQMQRSFWSLA